MTDDQLRALIREAVNRHVGTPPAPLPPHGHAAPEPMAPVFGRPPAPLAAHASHYQYVALVNVGEACVIEPTVGCNHCGYCRSHGH